MNIQNALVFDTVCGFIRREIGIQGAYFARPDPSQACWDAQGCYAVPGLIDLHIHGCVGYDFSTAAPDEIRRMAAYQAAQGVTALYPTTMTLPEEQLAHACERLAAGDEPDGAQLMGINLEGPFLSPERLGAQNPAHVHAPDAALFRRLQEASGGRIKLLSVAPEVPGALALIRALGDEVICSLAHTTADYNVAMRAFLAGARHVTHLYNAMPPLSHREPGVIGAAFDTPWCRVELICDGVHVHPAVVRATLRMLGEDRVIFVSDSMMATGLADGAYELGGLPVQVRGNTARLAQGGAIAGSVTNLMRCVRTAVRHARIPLQTAVKCATVNPAKALGIFSQRGSIEPGKYADLVLLDKDLEVRQVFLRGRPLETA